MNPLQPAPLSTPLIQGQPGLISGPWAIWFQQSLYERVGGAIGFASESLPLMDGIAQVGTEGKFSDGFHRHPSDTTKANDSDVVHKIGDESIDGTKTFQKSINAYLGVQFGTIVEPSVLVQGLTFWDESDNTLATVIDPVNGVVLQHGQEIQIRCVNKTGSTIPNGTAVFRTGTQGNRPTIGPALATTEANSQVIGVTTQDIANNAEGYITNFGIVRGIDTRLFVAGSSLYLSATTPGAMTNISPVSPNFNSYIGIPLNSTVNGSIFVRPRASLALDSGLGAPTPADTVSVSQNAVYSFWSNKDSTYLHRTGDESSTGIKTFAEIRAGLARFGDATNYTQFESDGTMVAKGTATTYNDMQFPISSGHVGAAGIPTWNSFVGNLSEYTFAINDAIDFGSQEVHHGYTEGSDMELHIHWATNGTDTTDRFVRWQVEYTIANMASSAPFSVFPSTTTVYAETTIPANTTSKSHIYTSIATIPGTGLKIGAQIKLRLKRIAASSTAPTSNPFALQVGIHFQQDTIGSRTTSSK